MLASVVGSPIVETPRGAVPEDAQALSISARPQRDILETIVRMFI
ncbi:MAG: hypothetical protein ACJA2E_001346 [Arenicella sp.]|jgi:hypothetical protein